MNKICTSIEQSKRLVELGIDINTADMIHNILGESYVRYDTPIDKYHTPAWSLAALMALIPKKQHPELVLNAHYKWICNISDPFSFAYKPMAGDNPLDAAFKMVYWLKKEKYI